MPNNFKNGKYFITNAINKETDGGTVTGNAIISYKVTNPRKGVTRVTTNVICETWMDNPETDEQPERHSVKGREFVLEFARANTKGYRSEEDIRESHITMVCASLVSALSKHAKYYDPTTGSNASLTSSQAGDIITAIRTDMENENGR